VRTLLVFRTKRVPEKANGKNTSTRKKERKLKVPQKAIKIKKIKRMEKWYDEKTKC